MNKPFKKQEMINAGDIDSQHIFCPICKNDEDLSLSGYIIVTRQERYRKGEDPKFETNPVPAGFEPKRMDCFNCQTSFFLIDKDLYEAQQTVSFLAEYIKRTIGKDLLNTGAVN